MVVIQGSERIGHSRGDVFRAGIRSEMWPEVDGLIIRPEEAVVARGGLIKVALDIAVAKIGVDTYVTECEPGEIVRLEGESNLVNVQVALELEDDGKGTTIGYSLKLSGKRLSVRLAEPAIGSFLNEKVPPFVTGYKDNVTSYLQGVTA